MKYSIILVAAILLLLVVFAPQLIPKKAESPVLSDADVLKIAENYVATSIQSSRVTSSTIISKADGKWKITVDYQQGIGANCKVGKCYWEGPAAMFCRQESNATLGTCQ